MDLIPKLWHHTGPLTPGYILNPFVGSRALRPLFLALRKVTIPAPEEGEAEVFMTAVLEMDEDKPLEEYGMEARHGFFWLRNAEGTIVPLAGIDISPLLKLFAEDGIWAAGRIESFILNSLREPLENIEREETRKLEEARKRGEEIRKTEMQKKQERLKYLFAATIKSGGLLLE